MVDTKQATVPEEWAADADEMGVSFSEYVRRMARAGRRQWGYEHNEEADEPHVQFEEGRSSPDEEIATIIQDTIVRNLSSRDGISEDELGELITGDIAEEVSNQLEELMREGTVEYSPTNGGWVLTE
ncbi:DUF5805 domain-containing protein [Natrinema sp. CBA1119]|uniref:DUF5805 domain-containing protein n=1 Tax=Natrinema sp. CBA1119 TaxID=1608465 RepID=UPI001146086A|nr:DUF5805 domain-containing protein [Natrinema sp. CBA1119]